MRKKTIIIIICYIIICLCISYKLFKVKKESKVSENNEIKEIKESIGFGGDNDLYEVQRGYNDIDILVVNPSIRFMVAYSGMKQNRVITLGEAKKIFEENYKFNKGIYIEQSSKEQFLDFLTKGMFNNTYYIDETGYLKINNCSENQTEYDKILFDAINSKYNYIINISSICYIVDEVTGELLDYNFEEMDKYQIYECVEDNDKIFISITENSKNLLQNTDIIASIIRVMER